MVLKTSVIVIGTLMILAIPISSITAGGPRLDYGDDVTNEEADCWVDGFDAGFAGKYDEDRANECKTETSDQYHAVWDIGCEYATYTEDQCARFKNNPVDIEDHEALQQENNQNCFNDGREDGEADRPYNKDRASGCSEAGGGGGYRDGYNSGCIMDSTEETCELKIEGEDSYCPRHPDIVACVEFLHNATNKRAESPYGTCAGMGDPHPNFSCQQEINPERYCLSTNNTVFCKTIGDICDADGFVKPEYPYCTEWK